MAHSPGVEKIIRFLSNDLDEPDCQFVRDWIKENPEHQAEFDRIADLWASYKKKAVFSVDIDRDWKALASRIHLETPHTILFSKKTRTIWVYRIAAMLVLGFAIWSIHTLFFTPPDSRNAYHSNSQNEMLLLSDGSKVWLNKNSTLNYPTHFEGKDREVELEGEAFFEIEKNEKHPFIIHSQNTTTKVLGTSFLVKSYPNTDFVKVSVKTGIVLFQSKNSKIKLTPGEEGTFDKQNDRLYKTTADLNDPAWHTHEFRFDKTSLKDVLNYLHQVYGKEIFVTSPLVLKCRFTGSYRDENLDKILNDIALTLQLTINRDNNKITLYGDGCQ